MKAGVWLLALVSLTMTSLLVLGFANGELAALLNPRVMPRTILGAVVFTIASLVLLVRSLRGQAASAVAGPGQLWPLLVPLALVPAALMATSSEQSDLRLFTAAGSRAPTLAAAAPGPGSGRTISGDPATGEAGGAWVDSPNDELLAAVAEATGHGTAGPTGPVGLQARGGVSGSGQSAPTAPGRTGSTAAGSERGDAALQHLLAESDPIVIESATFTDRINLIWDAPDAFTGRRLRMTGFAYRRDDWPVDTFVVARMSIWCCAADAAVVGIVARVTDAASAPVSGQWVEVEAELRTRERFEAGVVRMAHIPELVNLSWTPTDVPPQEYVFP